MEAIVFYASLDFTTSFSLRATCRSVRGCVDSVRSRHLVLRGDHVESSLGHRHPRIGTPTLYLGTEAGRRYHLAPPPRRSPPLALQFRDVLVVEVLDIMAMSDPEDTFGWQLPYDKKAVKTVRVWSLNRLPCDDEPVYDLAKPRVVVLFDWAPPLLLPYGP
jgi:hypothetical protein